MTDETAELKRYLEWRMTVHGSDASPWAAWQAATRERGEPVREALAGIVQTYAAYRGKGVLPAPTQYADLVRAIEKGEQALAAPIAPERADGGRFYAHSDGAITGVDGRDIGTTGDSKPQTER